MGTLPSFLEEAPGRSPPPWGTHSGSPPLSSILNKQEPLSHCPVPAPPFLHFPALIYSPSFDLGDSPPPLPSLSLGPLLWASSPLPRQKSPLQGCPPPLPPAPFSVLMPPTWQRSAGHTFLPESPGSQLPGCVPSRFSSSSHILSGSSSSACAQVLGHLRRRSWASARLHLLWSSCSPPGPALPGVCW